MLRSKTVAIKQSWGLTNVGTYAACQNSSDRRCCSNGVSTCHVSLWQVLVRSIHVAPWHQRSLRAIRRLWRGLLPIVGNGCCVYRFLHRHLCCYLALTALVCKAETMICFVSSIPTFCGVLVPSSPLQRDAPRASRLRAPELPR